MGKLLKLTEWDAATFQTPHSVRTLRTWAKCGCIQPAPQKIGRDYYVRADARYVAARNVDDETMRVVYGT